MHLPKFKWPRGKHNGQRIVGVSVKVKVRVDHWHWKPFLTWNWGMPCAHWLFIWSWWELVYASPDN
jgi:hypothetical protein